MSRVILLLFLIALSVSVLFSQTEKYLLQVGDERVASASWSPRSDLLLTSTGEANGLRLWDVSDGKILWKRDIGFLQDKTERYSISTYAWTEDQSYVLTGSANGKIQLWETESGKLLWNIRAHTGDVQAISLSPNGKILASTADASGDLKSELKIWERKDGQLLKDFGANHKAISRIRFLSNERFQTGNGYGQVSIWLVDKLTPLRTRQLKPCGSVDNKYNQIIYSPGFTFIATQCGKNLVIADVATVRILRKFANAEHYNRPSFSKNERVLFLPDSAGSRMLDLPTGTIKGFDDFDDGVLNDNGSLIAANSSYRYDGTRVYDLKTGKQQTWLVGHPGVITSLAFNLDGSRFASGSSDRIVRIWDTETKQILFSLEGHSKDVKSVEFTSDDKSLVSKSEDETIVWNAQTGAKTSMLRQENRLDEAKVVSLSGKFALVEEYEKPFRLIDAKTEETLKEFVYIDQLDNLVFTRDEKYFLAKPWWDGWQLWSVESGLPLRTFDVGYSNYNRVAFHPNGKIFITGGKGQNIFMFDLDTGEKVWSLFPIDVEEFEQKKAWEARRIGLLKLRETYAAQADDDNRTRMSNVVVSFSHYGTAESFWDQKIAGSGERKQSKLSLPKDKATVAWFTLTNGSDLPISIDTNSMMFDPKCKGLCDSSEISSRYIVELKDGTTRVNGIDMYARTVLPPKLRVFFSIDLGDLAASKSIYLGYKFQKDNPDDESSDDYGTEQKLYVRSSDLPKD